MGVIEIIYRCDDMYFFDSVDYVYHHKAEIIAETIKESKDEIKRLLQKGEASLCVLGEVN